MRRWPNAPIALAMVAAIAAGTLRGVAAQEQGAKPPGSQPTGAPSWSPGPTPQIKDMAWLVGHWSVTTRYIAPSGQEYPGQTESVIEPILNGSFLQEQIKVPMGKLENAMIGMRSYDRFRKVYRFVWFDSVITLADVYEGTMEKGDLTVSNVKAGTSVIMPGSPETFVRFTQHRVTDDEFSLIWEASTDNGQTWRKSAEYNYRRKS